MGKCGIKKELCFGDYGFMNCFHMYDLKWSFPVTKIASFFLLDGSLSLSHFLKISKQNFMSRQSKGHVVIASSTQTQGNGLV